MNRIVINLKLPAFISLMIVLPLMVLEVVNRQNFPGSFPYPLFAILWITMLAFIVLIRSIVRSFHTGMPNLPMVSLITTTVLVLALGFFWIGIVIDQMPCFLGVANCD